MNTSEILEQAMKGQDVDICRFEIGARVQTPHGVGTVKTIEHFANVRADIVVSKVQAEVPEGQCMYRYGVLHDEEPEIVQILGDDVVDGILYYRSKEYITALED
jgi:hypothetical protein